MVGASRGLQFDYSSSRQAEVPISVRDPGKRERPCTPNKKARRTSVHCGLVRSQTLRSKIDFAFPQVEYSSPKKGVGLSKNNGALQWWTSTPYRSATQCPETPSALLLFQPISPVLDVRKVAGRHVGI